MNHFRFHIGDYLKDTSHLSLLEHGVYLRLIQVYYTREEPLPEAEVARLIGARSTDEREALTVVLKEFFQVSDGKCHQPRCQAEIDAWHLLSETQSKKGRAGASKRWLKPGDGSSHEKDSSGHLNGGNGHSPAINSDGRTMASQLPTPNSQISEREALSVAPRSKVLDGAEGNGGPPPKRRGASRVPEDFRPDLAYARAHLPDVDAEAEAQKFRDWEFKTPRKDWPATWRTWISRCRESGKYAKSATATGGGRGLERLNFG